LKRRFRALKRLLLELRTAETSGLPVQVERVERLLRHPPRPREVPAGTRTLPTGRLLATPSLLLKDGVVLQPLLVERLLPLKRGRKRIEALITSPPPRR
jgi:hypothetical protein